MDRRPSSGGLQMDFGCLICDVAWSLGISEEKFYEFSDSERAQLVATYLSKLDREFVMSEFPIRKRRRQQAGD